MSTLPASPPQPAYSLGFQTQERETDCLCLPIEGELPDWLAGSLIRTGPAKFEVGGQSYRHWFDGLAMLHRFAIHCGGVTYSSRFLRSRSFCEAERKGRIVRSEFMTDPCCTLFGRLKAIFDPALTDNGSVNVAVLAGRMVALTETPMPVEFDPETLATLRHLDYGPAIGGQLSTAHPHHDGERAYAYTVVIGRRSAYRLLVEEGRALRVLAEIETDQPSYMHSFGMSESYIVVTEVPLRVHPLRLGLSGEPFIRRYRWQPGRGTVITVVDKRDGRIAARARTEPFFAFHHVNAFEDGGTLLIDLIAYPDASIIEDLTLDNLRSGAVNTPAGRLTRIRVPLGATPSRDPVKATLTLLSETAIELPRIDYTRRAGRRHRYVWGVGQTHSSTFLDAIVRIELGDDECAGVKTWAAPHCFPGEPVFVPRPGGTDEDDGVLLSVVLDAAAGRSFLLVLDAEKLTERARATVPHHIPFGFHGNHFPDPA